MAVCQPQVVQNQPARRNHPAGHSRPPLSGNPKMSAAELKTLAKLSKSGWKKLANADQSDADEVLAILREILEGIDQIEEAE